MDAPSWVYCDHLKANMYTDSRKVQHNSFAHYRAELLFTLRSTTNEKALSLVADARRGGMGTLQKRVRAGRLGAPHMQAGS
jgi:hypothetical protein